MAKQGPSTKQSLISELGVTATSPFWMHDNAGTRRAMIMLPRAIDGCLVVVTALCHKNG
jgi:hypothetical protein